MSPIRAARIPIVLASASLFVVCLTGAPCAAQTPPGATATTRARTQATRVQVATFAMPSLVGQAYQAALRDPAVVKFKLTLTPRETPSTRTPGTIIGQEPAAGSPIRPGASAIVLVAVPQPPGPRVEPTASTMPNLVGLDYGVAVRNKQVQTLKLQLVPREVAARVSPGVIVRHDPGPGAPVRAGASVVAYVAVRPPALPDDPIGFRPEPESPRPPVRPPPVEPRRVRMPDLVGRSFTQAVQHPQVLDAQLRLDQQFDTTAPGLPGTIVRQSVPAGTGVEVGRGVAVLVATGVAVPLVLKQTSGVAERQIAAAGLRPAVSTSTSDEEPGTVLTQVPAAGVMVSRGASVAITVAVAARVVVPDLVGRTRADAEQELARLELSLVAEDDALSAIEPGRVVTQQPASGADAVAGATVRVGVATGVTVPDVVGQSRERASALGSTAGLVVSVQSTTGRGAAGVVSRQEPPANARVARGTALTVFVPLTGALTVVVPDLVGQSDEAARRALAGLRLSARTAQQDSGSPVGTVLSQVPAAGTPVVPPSEVALVLARQPAQPAPPPAQPTLPPGPGPTLPLGPNSVEPLLPVWFGPLLVVVTLVGLSALGLVRSGRGASATGQPQPPPPHVEVEPQEGEHALRLEVQGRSLVALEVRVRVTKDEGEQSVQVAEGPLVAEERRVYE